MYLCVIILHSLVYEPISPTERIINDMAPSWLDFKFRALNCLKMWKSRELLLTWILSLLYCFTEVWAEVRHAPGEVIVGSDP